MKHVWAARERLRSAERARDRAHAARFLGRGRVAALAALPALVDATYDTKPMVRHAALEALARLGELAMTDALDARDALDAGDLAVVRDRARRDPVWWVRRAALAALHALAGDGVGAATRGEAESALAEALDDPFWRVRHAAVNLLAKRGRPVAGAETISAGGSERSRAALAYLMKRAGVHVTWPRDAHAPEQAQAPAGGARDPDPAVVTARLARGDDASPVFLAECLGDSHATLREAALERLHALVAPALAAGDVPRALLVACIWLEEPRIPYASRAVIRLLERLGDDAWAPFAEHVLSAEREREAEREGLSGAQAWALAREARRGLPRELAERFAAGPSVLARRVVAANTREADLLEALVTDADAEVARLAAASLAASPDGPRALLRVAREGRGYRRHAALSRRVLAIAAAAEGDAAMLREAFADRDPAARAVAVGALFAGGRLTEAELEALRQDPDPDVRAGVFEASRAAEVLRDENTGPLARLAFAALRREDPARAAREGAASPCAWIRLESASALAAEARALGFDAERARLLAALAADRSVGVRRTALDALVERDANDAEADAHLESLLERAHEHDAQTRFGAHLALTRGLDERALTHARAWAPREVGRAARLLRAIVESATATATATGVVVETAHVTPREPAPLATARRFARAPELAVSPLAISGVFGLRERDLARALAAGCDFFFWEPRHLHLGRFLRETPRARVITGSYHADEASIRADVERARRRLGRDTLDVFLLFWTRSEARLDDDVLGRLAAEGKIRLGGVSTHDRALACLAMEKPWVDVVMTRHSAMHPGAEAAVFPRALERGVSVLTFSALSYGRLPRGGVPAELAYRYSMHQPGVVSTISAPRTGLELDENLRVLESGPLDDATRAALCATGAKLHEESRDWNELIRRYPPALPEVPRVDRLSSPRGASHG